MKYIDAELLKKEITKHYDEYKVKFHQDGERYYLGLIDGIEMTERIIDSLQQEQPAEDLEEEIKKYEASLPESATVDPFEGHPTLKDIAHHFYELGKQAKKEE